MKPKDIFKGTWPQLFLLAVPFLVLVLMWDKFPARIAIHWGWNGKPNGWADKEWGLWLLPVTNIGIALCFAFLPQLAARVKSYDPETQANQRRVVKVLGLAIGSFLAVIALLIDAVALGWQGDLNRVVILGIFILFAVLGSYLPKLKPNRFVGIRNSWTLQSPEVWMRTHRLFGPIMSIGSLMLAVPCVFLPSTWSIFLLLSFVLLISFGSIAYSYRVRQTSHTGDSA